MDRPSTLHSNFFSFLKQVEKRLKLDNLSPPTDRTSVDSLSSPLYLFVDHNHPSVDKCNSYLGISETPSEFLSNSVDFPQTDENPPLELPQVDARIENCVENDGQSSNFENSETPVEFFSNSVEFPQTHENPSLECHKIDARIVDCVGNDVDEIGLLFELLGLSGIEREGSKTGLEEMNMTCSSCHCVGGFYEKIVGIKGPRLLGRKCRGWIKLFEAEKIEPFRLAHLLLGKATCINADGGEFEGAEFPSTVEKYLRHDPPIKSWQEESDGG